MREKQEWKGDLVVVVCSCVSLYVAVSSWGCSEAGAARKSRVRIAGSGCAWQKWV